MTDAVEAFIARWQSATGSEKANYQLFLTELCETLGLPRPDPASDDTADNAYVFERRVTFRHGDGSDSRGFIDLYRRGAFVCEAKQTGKTLGSGQWDDAMLRARGQAEQYARALPADEGRPPFLIVTDVGRNIELYSEFTRSGATYVPYPDPRSHRIRLEDLRREEIRQRLTAVWNEPLALDPTRQSARVTRDIAEKLAVLAKSMEGAGHPSEVTAGFLMRCLFTMFAEDVGLLPKRSFTELLESLRDAPEQFVPMVQALWTTMNSGGFSPVLRADLLRFNGGLFADAAALPLNKSQIDQLIEAAHADWRHVEPAIFGTLLERALDPHERHRLGAHYTPRAYVERLVMPTVIEPLREEWRNVQAAAFTLDRQGKHKDAVQQIQAFQQRLCDVRVLDPACGSGNFLYVTLEHLKRLEGEVLNALEELGERQELLDMQGVSVDPHQFLGIETNPRAARIAEAVLWIGYLQWHYRTRGNVRPPEPVLKDFHNIENRDAVLDWDRIEFVLDDSGKPITRWDGRSYKKHPVTGEDVPDETAQVPLERYVNPRKAQWPKADFVVGNPPFIGNKRMRAALGDGYVGALRNAWSEVPESADFVMYWWHKAALLVRGKSLERFGLITTNSLRQTYSRRVLDLHLAAKDPVSLVFAVPDHPWVDSADGAAVRIAMTVASSGNSTGRELTVNSEAAGDAEGADVTFVQRTGIIRSDLSVGAAVSTSVPLLANSGVCWQGCKLVGSHFQISPEQANNLTLANPNNRELLRYYWAGNDVTKRQSVRYVIDTYGFTDRELLAKYPEIYQHLHDFVKPERDHNRDKTFREKWWQFGRPRPELRSALSGIERYVVTSEVSKHRFFVPLSWPADLIDGSVIAITLEDEFFFGVLSSRLHISWALKAGGTLEDRPRYQNGPCFDPFPFPDASDAQKVHIRALAEELDAHRKRQQAQHPELTLTGMYNVLEKLRAGEALTAKEKTLHEQGLVSVLRELHDELDRAVFAAYGWDDLAEKLVGRPGATTPLPDKAAEQAEAEEELLMRLVALNAEHAAEEAKGKVRWLRPEFQARGSANGTVDGTVEMSVDPAEVAVATTSGKKPAWPKTLPEQVQAVRTAIGTTPGAITAEQLARQFQRARVDKLAELLETLAALGQVRRTEENEYLAL